MSKIALSREAIKAVYAAGEAAVIELVEGITAQHMALVKKLLTQQVALEARIKALEDKQKKNSCNNSNPPLQYPAETFGIPLCDD